MTDIAIRAEQNGVQPYSDAALDRLEQWGRTAATVQSIAVVVVKTKMCPQAYRNKPDEATAAMLAGVEMGLMPMASLRAFDDIQGTPAPKAITLRAVVQSRGHELEIVESGPTRAVAEGKRKGSDRWQRIEWTIERAQQAGYAAKNTKYQTDPTAQLVARATAEMARWLDSAAIMGMPISAEEIADQPIIDAAPVVRRLTAADLDAPAEEFPELREFPEDRVGADQHRHMHALWNELGYSGDANRDTRLAITAKILGLEQLDTSADLTRAQADQVIAALAERKNRAAEQ
jgi:hypothetical protein